MREETELWRRTLGATFAEDTEKRAADKLRAAFATFRERAAMIAAEISTSAPSLTVHDVTHLDALWEMADLAAGPSFPVNPVEAFLLGGAFLTHDLANGLAAYPSGQAELRSLPGWRDVVAYWYRKLLNQVPTPAEIDAPPKEVAAAAQEEMLRKNHAHHAATLTLTSWRHSQGGDQYFLIDDPTLRNLFGTIIGKLANSHWWDIANVAREFPADLGAPDFAPRHWSADTLKLACLLRTADAIHADARRAPHFMRILRQTAGLSDDHWKFQGKITKPYARDGRIVFTSSSPFSQCDASAWWLCFDTMGMIDKELRQVDSLLVDRGRARLQFNGVWGVDNAERFSERVQTDGWIPIDVRVRVTDVRSLVSRLGGEQLYGKHPEAPLKELVQNSCDAIRARRIQDQLPSNYGRITVRRGEDDVGTWIEVEDDGLGMSKAVVRGPLLDFGVSYWSTVLMRDECPGLLSKGFTPTGKFGIGFFSVFMWGERVRITTRRAEEARADTRVLEFETGLNGRPILRAAKDNEQLRLGGTIVRVWLRSRETFSPKKRTDRTVPLPLHDICRSVFPSIDVDLFTVDTDGNEQPCIAADDWKTLSGIELLRRAQTPNADRYGPNVRDIVNGRDIVGRGCIVPQVQHETTAFTIFYDRQGVLTIGGQRATHLVGIGGILLGRPTTASRLNGTPLVDGASIAQWATEQAGLLSELPIHSMEKLHAASTIRRLGGDTGPLPICRFDGRWLSASNIAEQPLPDVLYIIEHGGWDRAFETDATTFNDNVFALEPTWNTIIQESSGGASSVKWPQLPEMYDGRWWNLNWTLEGLLIDAIAKAWGVTPGEVLKSSVRPFENLDYVRTVGHDDNGKSVHESVAIIRRPGSDAASNASLIEWTERSAPNFDYPIF